MKICFFALSLLFLSMVNMPQAKAFELYTGIGAGLFGVEIKSSTINQQNSVPGGFVKFGVDFNDYIAAELRVGTTGKGTSSYAIGTPVKISGLIIPSPLPFDFSMQADYFVSYLIKPAYEVAQTFQIYGLLGGTTANVKSTFSVAGIPAGSVTTSGFSYGVGAEYVVADQWKAGAEWVQYWTDVKTGTTSKARIWGAVASLNYHF